MKYFFIITNQSKDVNLQVTQYVRSFLEKHGKKCDVARYKGNADREGILDAKDYVCTIPEGVDCCIVLGGDGTMLQASHNVLGRDIPVLGVNLGTLGYLAEVEKSGLDEALAQLLAEKYTLEKRMMLSGEIQGGIRDDALNDIVIARKATLQVISFNIYVNDLYLNNYHADGMIISTPTGSTGYNMSAGGPIVEPGAQMILLTPICPHTLTTRSIVLSAEDRITVEIAAGRDDISLQAEASFDGRNGFEMRTGDRIIITRSAQTTKILKLNQVSFLEVLHRKLI